MTLLPFILVIVALLLANAVVAVATHSRPQRSHLVYGIAAGVAAATVKAKEPDHGSPARDEADEASDEEPTVDEEPAKPAVPPRAKRWPGWP